MKSTVLAQSLRSNRWTPSTPKSHPRPKLSWAAGLEQTHLPYTSNICSLETLSLLHTVCSVGPPGLPLAIGLLLDAKVTRMFISDATVTFSIGTSISFFHIVFKLCTDNCVWGTVLCTTIIWIPKCDTSVLVAAAEAHPVPPLCLVYQHLARAVSI